MLDFQPYHAVLAVKDEREDALAACGGLRSLTAPRAVIAPAWAIPPNESQMIRRRIQMNSFKVTAVGNLARNPEVTAKGDMTYTRFCLVGNDYAGRDDEGQAREVVTSVWFVAFNGLGEAIARNTRKGDQLIVEARIRANQWDDGEGGKHYDHSYIVEGFRFGAPGPLSRDELAQRQAREG